MKNKRYIVLSLALLVVVLSACTTKETVENKTPVVGLTPTSTQVVTLSEVNQHASPDNCWMIIDGKAYDFSPYIKSGLHPGGDKILNGCGKDASEIFASIEKHSGRARQDMGKYLIIK
ncbi:MAG: cytochrome b5-like heme/steroid binding domain-containing protein [Patescibacteria group bacterium]